MNNWIVIFIFLVFDRKYAFFENLFQNIKIAEAKTKKLEEYEYVKFDSDFHWFFIRFKIPFLGEFGLKTQNCQFKLTLGTYTISNR